MKKIKLLPLAVAITIGIYGLTATTTFAQSLTPPVSGDVDNVNLSGAKLVIDGGPYNYGVVIDSAQPKDKQGRIVIKADISTTNTPAITLEDKLGLRYTMQIGGDRANTAASSQSQIKIVKIVSENNEAILFKGDSLRANSDGIEIWDGSTVEGKTAAIDASHETKNSFKIGIYGGTVKGDIKLGNAESGKSHTVSFDTNLILSGNGSDPSKVYNATNESFFKGNISGVDNVVVNGKLTIASGENGTNLGKANFSTKADSKLTLLLENKDITNPLITSKSIKLGSNDITLKLGNGVTVNDLKDKDIKLFEATNGTKITGTGAAATTIKLIDSNGDDLTRPEPEVTNGWLTTQNTAGSAKVIATPRGDFIFNYEEGGVRIVTNKSKAQFLANITNPTEKAFANYILNKVLNNDGNEAEEFLSKYPSNAEAKMLAKQMLPDLSNGEVSAALAFADSMRDNLVYRSLRYNYQRPSYERVDGWNVWVKPIIARGKNSQENGYKLTRYGLQAGLDQQINDEALIGFSVGLNRNSISPNNNSITKKSTQFVLMPYVEWRNDLFFLGGNVNVGANVIDSKRTIGNSEANGNYNAVQLGMELTAGLNKQFKGVNIRPYIGYKRQWITVKGYKETGSELALQYTSQKYGMPHLGGGISLSKELDTKYGKLVPSFEFKYFKQLGSKNPVRQKVFLASDISTGNSADPYYINGNNVFGDQLEVKLNTNFSVSEKINIQGSVGYNQFGNYKEAILGVNFSNNF